MTTHSDFGGLTFTKDVKPELICAPTIEVMQSRKDRMMVTTLTATRGVCAPQIVKESQARACRQKTLLGVGGLHVTGI